MWFLFLPFPLQELRSEMGVWGLRVPWYGLDFKLRNSEVKRHGQGQGRKIRNLEWHCKTPSSILDLQASWAVGHF